MTALMVWKKSVDQTVRLQSWSITSECASEQLFFFISVAYNLRGSPLAALEACFGSKTLLCDDFVLEKFVLRWA